MAKKTKNKPLWHPILWPTWILVFLAYLLTRLPWEKQQKLGDRLGALAYKYMKSRTKVTRKNIQVCFPDLSTREQEALVEQTFRSVGKGLMESLTTWMGDPRPALENMTVIGEAHVMEAIRNGKGILLIGGHYNIFDIALPLIASLLPKPGYMYRPNDNPVIDRMIERGRRRHYNIQAFSKWEMKSLIKFLQQGGMVWYACDQDFGRRSEVFVPFFGVPTACLTTPSRIAQESGASVLCVSHLRRPDGSYEIAFSPILKNFGEDAVADATAWNNYLEMKIRQYPDQYLWLHRRFKTRPPGTDPVY